MDIGKSGVAFGLILAIAGFVPWLLDQRGYAMPPLVILLCGVIAILAISICCYYPFHPRLIPAVAIAFMAGIAVTSWWIGPDQLESKQAMRDKWKTYKYTEVWDKTFRDETVPIDGFHFRRCKFINVTFLYNGTAPVKFNEWSIEGTHHLDTIDPVVQSSLRLMLAIDQDGRKMAERITTTARPLKPWEQ